MRREELDILLQDDVREAISQHIGCDPLKVALKANLPSAREVATQVKYLAKARTKLPSLYAARAIIPPRAFEQSSSEESAAAKLRDESFTGETLLDLTCGLGIDAMTLARRFKRVVALERDEVLVEVVRENFRRMGVENVEVVCASAEEYVASCTAHFDWIYADPDRRTAEGKRVVRLEDCSPNMVALMPRLRELADNIAIKNSPLFDVDEALRIFHNCRVEVVSLAGECKEVMVYTHSERPTLAAYAIGRGYVEYPLDQVRMRCEQTPLPEVFRSEEYGYLIIPDVALQKGRLVRASLVGVADVWSENGFAFAIEQPQGVVGRVESIERIEPFDVKHLRREMKGRGVDIVMREFPISMEELRKRCGLRSGSERRIALCRVAGRSYTIYLK